MSSLNITPGKWQTSNNGIRRASHIAVGEVAVDTSGSIVTTLSGTTSAAGINNQHTLTDGTLTNNGAVLNVLSINASGNNASNWIGQNGIVEITSGNNKNYTGLVAGDGGGLYNNGSGLVTEFDAVFGIYQNINSGTITNAQGGRFININTGSGAITNNYGLSTWVIQASGTNVITNSYGYLSQNPLIVGGSVTNNYGIYVQGMTSGTTTNYGVAIGASTTQTLWVGHLADSTSTAAGTAFGLSRDTIIHRSAANNFSVTTAGVIQATVGDPTVSPYAALELMPTDRNTASAAGAIASFIKVDNTYTSTAANAFMPAGFDYNPTLIFGTDGYSFGSEILFWAHPKIQNNSGSTRTMGVAGAFADQHNYQANGGTFTAALHNGFLGQPTFDRINSGTLNVTAATEFSSNGFTVGAGATVTTYTHFSATQGTNSGTLTTQIGLDIGAMSVAGTTNIGARIGLGGTYSLQLSSTAGTAASGITFGTDTNLYRSAANTLKTDDAFQAAGGIDSTRFTKRVTTVNAPGATPTSNTDTAEILEFTGLATAITSMTTNLSGTPVNGDLREFMFLDDGTARAITWGASFANGGLVNLPTTTIISTMLRVIVQYQTTASLNKWVCVTVA